MSNDRTSNWQTGSKAAAELPPQSSGWGFFAVLLIVAGFGYFLASLLRIPPGGDDRHVPMPGPGLIGTKAPEIKAQGWFNGPAPTAGDLNGKIIVLDAWAYWCGPCRHKAPALIKLYEEYSPKGVVFLGLTNEDHRMLKQSEEFIADTKIPWPQGYGVDTTLAKLNADYIPQVWVVDQKGIIAWDQTAPDEVSKTLDQLLK